MKFLSKISSVNVTKSAVPGDLVTFTEEIVNGKHDFLSSVGAVTNKAIPFERT